MNVLIYSLTFHYYCQLLSLIHVLGFLSGVVCLSVHICLSQCHGALTLTDRAASHGVTMQHATIYTVFRKKTQKNFYFNLQITHGDMKENVSGCFFLYTVYYWERGLYRFDPLGRYTCFQFKRVEEMNELNVSLFCPYLLTY